MDAGKDTLLVYNKDGSFQAALNLDGTKNDYLTNLYKGKSNIASSTVINNANNGNDKDKDKQSDNNPFAGSGSTAAAGSPMPPDDDNDNRDKDDNSKADNTVKNDKTADQLNQKQESAVKKIDNLVKNSLKDHDIEGALKDMSGNPVPKADGTGYWNHLKELQDTLNGLRNHANTLKDVNNPTAQAAKQKALEAI